MSRCRHGWKEIGRVFSPPTRREIEIQGVSHDVMMFMTYGVTTVELGCIRCGDIASRLLVGDVT